MPVMPELPKHILPLFEKFCADREKLSFENGYARGKADGASEVMNGLRTISAFLPTNQLQVGPQLAPPIMLSEKPQKPAESEPDFDISDLLQDVFGDDWDEEDKDALIQLAMVSVQEAYKSKGKDASAILNRLRMLVDDDELFRDVVSGKQQLGWEQATSRRGNVMAVGVNDERGSHAGKKLYGAQAQRVLGQNTARGKRDAFRGKVTPKVAKQDWDEFDTDLDNLTLKELKDLRADLSKFLESNAEVKGHKGRKKTWTDAIREMIKVAIVDPEAKAESKAEPAPTEDNGEATSKVKHAKDMTPKEFGKYVNDLAKDVQTGWIGGSTVLISHVWDEVKDRPEFRSIGFTDFKKKLVESLKTSIADGSRSIQLSPADLPQRMDQEQLARSLTNVGSSEYHFIKTKKNDNPTPKEEPVADVASDQEEPKASTDNIKDFSQRLYDIAYSMQDGKFGDNKVFISKLYDEAKKDPYFSDLSMDKFKKMLVMGNREDTLGLSRADLVQAMNKDDVANSRISHLGGEYNFLLLDDEDDGGLSDMEREQESDKPAEEVASEQPAPEPVKQEEPATSTAPAKPKGLTARERMTYPDKRAVENLIRKEQKVPDHVLEHYGLGKNETPVELPATPDAVKRELKASAEGKRQASTEGIANESEKQKQDRLQKESVEKELSSLIGTELIDDVMIDAIAAKTKSKPTAIKKMVKDMTEIAIDDELTEAHAEGNVDDVFLDDLSERYGIDRKTLDSKYKKVKSGKGLKEIKAVDAPVEDKAELDKYDTGTFVGDNANPEMEQLARKKAGIDESEVKGLPKRDNTPDGISPEQRDRLKKFTDANNAINIDRSDNELAVLPAKVQDNVANIEQLDPLSEDYRDNVLDLLGAMSRVDRAKVASALKIPATAITMDAIADAIVKQNEKRAKRGKADAVPTNNTDIVAELMGDVESEDNDLAEKSKQLYEQEQKDKEKRKFDALPKHIQEARKLAKKYSYDQLVQMAKELGATQSQINNFGKLGPTQGQGGKNGIGKLIAQLRVKTSTQNDLEPSSDAVTTEVDGVPEVTPEATKEMDTPTQSSPAASVKSDAPAKPSKASGESGKLTSDAQSVYDELTGNGRKIQWSDIGDGGYDAEFLGEQLGLTTAQVNKALKEISNNRESLGGGKETAPKPVATPTPKVEPKKAANIETDASGKPKFGLNNIGSSEVPHRSPEVIAKGNEILDSGIDEKIQQAYNHLTQFSEYRDGMVKLPDLYHEMTKYDESFTPGEFLAAVSALNAVQGVQLHTQNEVQQVAKPDRELSIYNDDRMYHYLLANDSVQEGGKGAPKLDLAKLRELRSGKKGGNSEKPSASTKKVDSKPVEVGKTKRGGIDIKHTDPKVIAAGNKLLDSGLDEQIANAYNHLAMFNEFRDGMVTMPALYHQMTQDNPKLTKTQFAQAVSAMNAVSGAELHELNEVHKLKPEDREFTIDDDDRFFHYFMAGGKVRDTTGNRTELDLDKLRELRKGKK